MTPTLAGVVIETFQCFLGIVIFHLDDLEDFLDSAETFFARQIRRISVLIFASSIMLNLLAGIFDLRKT